VHIFAFCSALPEPQRARHTPTQWDLTLPEQQEVSDTQGLFSEQYRYPLTHVLVHQPLKKHPSALNSVKRCKKTPQAKLDK